MNPVQWITSSIRNKMLIITGSGTTLLLASSLIGLWLSWHDIAQMKQDALLNSEEAHQLVNIQSLLGQEVHEWKNTLLRGSQDASALEQHWNGVLQSEQQVRDKLQALKSEANNVQIAAQIEAFSKAHQAMSDQYNAAHLIFLGNRQDPNAADRAAAGADRGATKALGELSDLVSELAKSRSSASAENAMKTIQVALGMMGVAILLAFVVFLTALQRGIISPAHQLVRDLDLLAQGDFSRLIAQTTQDEIGQVAASAEKIRQDLGAVIANVKSASNTVAQSAQALAAGSGQIVSGSATQSEAASATAAAVEQMTVSIQSVADNADEVRSLSHTSLQNTSEGKQRLDDLANHIAQTVHAMEDIAQSVQQFVASTATITSMTQQVKDIADQTNLLALNASIEAARAGEQGRGFAVVADEVRKLAEKSAQSASEIDGVTRALENQSQHVSQALGRGQQFLKSSQGAMDTAASAMETTYAAMQRSSQGVDAITDSVREQTAASNDIARHIERIAHMAEENNAGIASTSDAAQQLQHLASNLKETVSRFRT